MKKLKLLLITFIFSYLSVAFISWSLNPVDWDVIGRILMVLATYIFYVIFSELNKIND